MPSLIIGQYDQGSCVLKLETSQRNDIDNEQFKFISSFELSTGSGLETEYAIATFKGQATAVYNCHGMTFACKRTGIYDNAVIEKILREDNYIEIKDEKDVLAGDVILYFDDTGISHSGIVLNVSKANSNDLTSVSVLSKWSKYKEVIHDANYSPYSNGLKKYWRINHGFKII